MKIPNQANKRSGIATIALMLLTSTAVLTGLAPGVTADTPACFDTGNQDAVIYVRVCMEVMDPAPVEEIPGEHTVQVRAPVTLQPEYGEDFCIVGEVCAEPPKHVTNWIRFGWDEMEIGFDQLVNVSRANLTGTTVQIDKKQLEDVACGAIPPVCTQIDNTLRETLGAVDVVRPASKNGATIDGVLLTGENGTSIYLGFANAST